MGLVGVRKPAVSKMLRPTVHSDLASATAKSQHKPLARAHMHESSLLNIPAISVVDSVEEMDKSTNEEASTADELHCKDLEEAGLEDDWQVLSESFEDDE